MASLGSSCSDMDAFTDIQSRGELAAYVLFFVVYLVLFVLFILSKTKSLGLRNTLADVFFGLSIICNFIVLEGMPSFRGDVAMIIFEHIGEFLPLVTILLFTTSYLQFLAGGISKRVRTIYGVITALFGVITLAYIAVDSYRLTHGCSAPGRVCPADNRLGTAYYAIYLDLSLAAVITMIVSLAQMSSRQVASRAHKIWIPILGISQILWINLMVFKFEYWVLESHVESEGTSVALEFLIDFFQAVAYLSVILFGKVLLLLLNQLMARRSLTMEARQSMPRTTGINVQDVLIHMSSTSK
ncbi:hypothetical protein AOQ84DRAFT_388695 [Glonium stellatum]|uniref:Uncharacterized protein n=1 Tax=Glonium stellatum TaxID=574774 RepID=A0A8E2F1C4_9PEZI|nr:hypothetical protein AOQ84DRAFT_388695 [Glonium stellatum]